MRCAAFAGLLGLLFASRAAASDPAPYLATVIDPEVKVRAGPSEHFEETGALRQNSRVIVERDEGDEWLAITAPAGSVSWVRYSFVQDLSPDQPAPKEGLVNEEGEITLACGKAGSSTPFNIRLTKLPGGTIVTLIGPPVEYDRKKWLPIVPPPGDIRYIRKAAVRAEKPANDNFTVRVTDTGGIPPAITPAGSPPTAGGPLATIPGPGGVAPAGGGASGVTASKPAVNHPLWVQAETAEREGRLADAEKAYFDLAAIMNSTGNDHDLANLCYTRIHAIREQKRNAARPASSPAPQPAPTGPLRTNVLQPPSKSDRPVRPGAPQPLPMGEAGTSSGGSNTGPSAQWSGPGTIRRSVLTPDGTGKRAYALETAPGVVKVYVLEGPGVDLEKYLGRKVEVYGAPQTHNKLSKPYMTATAVELAQ